jgi:phospholipid/cholesterol/gamma-HCH transport system ATP-binding protein
MLQVEHLKKHFGNQVVLNDINLTVDKGDVLCILGQSGSGKTVLFRHIIGLLFPDGGRILLDGKEISNPTTKPADFDRVRKRFGILFQGAALFDSMDVGENLAFPLREHTKLTEREINREICDALEKVGLREEFKAKMPSELSGGMRSRVGLARAIVMKPEIMLYDEPTSALDPIMTDKINELIKTMRQDLGMTSIVISHDIGSAYKVANKIAMIHDGKIIFNGTSANFRWSKNPYVQDFISGYRDRFYAFDQEETYGGQVDVSKITPRAVGPRGAQSKPAPAGLADKKFEMPVKVAAQPTQKFIPPGKRG